MMLILQKAWRSHFRYGQKFYRTKGDRRHRHGDEALADLHPGLRRDRSSA